MKRMASALLSKLGFTLSGELVGVLGLEEEVDEREDAGEGRFRAMLRVKARPMGPLKLEGRRVLEVGPDNGVEVVLSGHVLRPDATQDVVVVGHEGGDVVVANAKTIDHSPVRTSPHDRVLVEMAPCLKNKLAAIEERLIIPIGEFSSGAYVPVELGAALDRLGHGVGEKRVEPLKSCAGRSEEQMPRVVAQLGGDASSHRRLSDPTLTQIWIFAHPSDGVDDLGRPRVHGRNVSQCGNDDVGSMLQHNVCALNIF